MKRFHMHVAVEDLEESIRFYSVMFGTQPSVHKPDYAKWMLEDPRINFAISQRGLRAGIDHIGFQLDSDEELKAMRANAAAAELAVLDQPGASCCYAKSDKYWITDPSGIAWETYHTLDTVPTYGDGSGRGAVPAEVAELAKESISPGKAACCAPTSKAAKNAVNTTAASVQTSNACC